MVTFYLRSSWYKFQMGCSCFYNIIKPHLANYTNVSKYRARNTTWVYSNDCQRKAAISGDLPKAASVLSSSAFRTGGILHCRSPRITTTGVHWGCSQSARRAFSLWALDTKRTRDFTFSKAKKNDQQSCKCLASASWA